MAYDSTSRETLSLAALVALLLFVAIAVAGHPLYFRTEILEHGDLAVNALQIESAKSGRELYGNYSRFQFNHPGPAFFYVYAVSELLLHDAFALVPTPHNAHLLGSLALQVGFFALALAILHGWFRSPWFLAAALAGAAWHFTHTAGAFTSLWPPHVLLMPSLCFIVACTSFAAGRRHDFAVMVVAGGFLFHGHVAQPLFVGGLGVLACHLHLRQRGLGWRDLGAALQAEGSRLLWFTGAALALFLLPLAIDVVRFGRESNVAAIIGRFAANTQDGKSVLQSFLYFLSFGGYGVNQDEAFTHLGRETVAFFRAHFWTMAAWWLVILVPAVILQRNRAALPAGPVRFARCAYLVFGATVVLCVLWGLVQSGPMFHFNGFFYYGVYFFGALIGLGVVLNRFTPPAPAAGLITTFCLAAIGFTHGFHATTLSPTEAGQDVREGVAQVLRQQKSSRAKLLVFEHYLWPEAMSVALELKRRGIPFYTAHSWNFMVGRTHDITRLGDDPTGAVDVWWVAEYQKGGTPIKPRIAIFPRPPELDPRGAALAFGLKQNGFRHLVSGLSTGNTAFAFAEEKAVRFSFHAVPASADVQLILDADVNPVHDRPKQTAEVWLHRQLVGKFDIGARAQSTLMIPAALWNLREHATLELRFPDAVPLHDYRRPAFKNWASIRFWNLWFATAVAEPAAPAEPKPAFTLEESAVAPRFPLTEQADPAGDRLDFTKSGRGAAIAHAGLAAPEATLTRIEGRHAALLLRAKPAIRDIQVEIVALPYTTGPGAPPHQRCRLSFNGRLIFDSPFTEPGVIRAVVPAYLWNAQPIAVMTLDLPDATDPAAGKIQSGLALRWLAVHPTEPSP